MKPEFSYKLNVVELPEGGESIHILADADEMAALAKRFGVASLNTLEANLQVRHQANGARVQGNVKATGAQNCVVTGELVDFSLVEDVDTLYLPDIDAAAEASEDWEDLDLEPLDGAHIDLGELAAQIFGIGLDPYPRKPGLPPSPEGAGSAADRPSPFAVLRKLKDQG